MVEQPPSLRKVLPVLVLNLDFFKTMMARNNQNQTLLLIDVEVKTLPQRCCCQQAYLTWSSKDQSGAFKQIFFCGAIVEGM